MAPHHFSIVLNREIPCYFPGEVVSGNVVIKCTKALRMRGVFLELQGKARTSWSETLSAGQNRGSSTDNVHYFGSEDYFHNVILLYGHGDDLPAGDHQFPFEFELPSRLPSSFEGNYGFVRYTVKARVDRPWAFDFEAKIAFSVNSIVDLNREPTARLGITGETSKYLCCWCCRSGPIHVQANLKKSGFVPGEIALVTAQINNNSNRVITNVKIALLQHLMYRGQSFVDRRIRCDIRTVAQMKQGSVLPKQLQKWEDVPLVVPPIPPTHLGECAIIDVLYSIDLIIDPSGPANDLTLSFPIQIGTVPALDVFQQLQPPEQPPSYEEQGSPSPFMALPIQDYPNLPPPSYAACVFGSRSIREEGESEAILGNLQFAPRYPTYGAPETVSNMTPPSPSECAINCQRYSPSD